MNKTKNLKDEQSNFLTHKTETCNMQLQVGPSNHSFFFNKIQLDIDVAHGETSSIFVF